MPSSSDGFRRGRFARFGGLLLSRKLEPLLLVLLLGIVLRWSLWETVRLDSDMMAPGLHTGDILLAWKLPFGLNHPLRPTKLLQGRLPRRGEIVIFRCEEGAWCASRVVAVGGDRIEIVKQRLVLNGVICDYAPLRRLAGAVDFRESCMGQSWPVRWDISDEEFHVAPGVVPQGHVALAMDYRSSRRPLITLAPVDGIVGRAVRVILSWGGAGQSRPRFLSAVH